MDINSMEISDRKSFIQFLDLLHMDFIKNKQDWENDSLSSFLEALQAYVTDIQGYYDNTHQNIDADVASMEGICRYLARSKNL